MRRVCLSARRGTTLICATAASHAPFGQACRRHRSAQHLRRGALHDQRHLAAAAPCRFDPPPTPWASHAIHGGVLALWLVLFARAFGGGGLFAWSAGLAYATPAPGRMTQSAAHPGLGWLRLPPGGKAAALNAALLLARPALVLTVDADTLLDRDALATVRRAFAVDSALVAATGVLSPECGTGDAHRAAHILRLQRMAAGIHFVPPKPRIGSAGRGLQSVRRPGHKLSRD